MANRKLEDHGEYIQGDFLELPFDDNFFDCTICLNVLFHVPKEKQVAFVRKLIKVTKPGGKIVLIYANSHSLLRKLALPLTLAKSVVKKATRYTSKRLYYHANPLVWWDQFDDEAEISLHPHRSMSTSIHKAFFPNNALGEKLFEWLGNLEEVYPDFFVRNFEFPFVVLTPKPMSHLS